MSEKSVQEEVSFCFSFARLSRGDQVKELQNVLFTHSRKHNIVLLGRVKVNESSSEWRRIYEYEMMASLPQISIGENFKVKNFHDFYNFLKTGTHAG
jgi:hypothetical protein